MSSCISMRCTFTDCAWLVELYSTWIWTNKFFHWGQRHCWHFFLFSWTTRAISKHLKIIGTCDLHKNDHVIYRWTASPFIFCDVGRVGSTDKNTPSIASKCKVGSTCVGRHLCLELYRRCTFIWAHTTHRVHSSEKLPFLIHEQTNCATEVETPLHLRYGGLLLNIINLWCRLHYEPFHSGWQCLWNQITLVLTSTSLKISMSYNM
jgi:hypothetical protein